MEIRLLFKRYPQIRWVSSFTVCAFSVSTFLQSSVYNYISKDNKKKQQQQQQKKNQTNKTKNENNNNNTTKDLLWQLPLFT